MAKLHFRYGTMASAKTALALMHIYNFQEHGYNALLCKPTQDTRTKEVWSRVGLKQNAIFIDQLTKMKDSEISQYKVIIVDEAQFCKSEEIDHLAHIADFYDIPVFAYGLRTDYTTHLFEGSKRLFELADEIEELKTSCWCGHSAKVNARIENGQIVKVSKDGSTIDIENKSGEQKYRALCRKHYNDGLYEMPEIYKHDKKVKH